MVGHGRFLSIRRLDKVWGDLLHGKSGARGSVEAVGAIFFFWPHSVAYGILVLQEGPQSHALCSRSMRS